MATIGQLYDCLSIIANRARQAGWEDVPQGGVQVTNGTPDLLVQNFILFMRNGGRVNIDGLKVATAPFDPVVFVGEGWGLIVDEHDARNHNLTEIDFSKVDFPHCLNDGEDTITGEEKLKRLKVNERVRYGAAVFMGLWKDYETRKENSVLEMLYRTKDIIYIDFMGDVLLDPDGRRRVLYLYRNGDGEWDWGVDWLGHDWNRQRGSAVSQVLSTQALVPQT